MIVIVDSDALIGSLYPQDQHYKTSRQIQAKLAKINAKLIYPATVIVETVTFLQGRLNKPGLAQQMLELVNSNELVIESIGSDIIQQASGFMDLNSSKHNTLFDAIVAAVAKNYDADAIFSFDKFYKTKGFKLASEFSK